MRAVVLENTGQPLVVSEVPAPDLGPRDALVRVRAVGVCHTDLHVADGLFAAMGVPAPPILGHEVVGVVEAVGDEVTHLQPGERVGVYWIYSCGHCRFCVAGKEQVCPEARYAGVGGAAGGYAEFIAAPAANVLPLPPGLAFADAAPLFCGGLTMFSALKNGGLQPGQRAAVLGIGGLGHLGLAIARAMGAEVIAITSTEAKAEAARQMGAHEVVTVAEMGERLPKMGGADVLVSTTLDTGAITQALACLARLGSLVLTGATLDPIPVVPAALFLQQQRVIGSVVGSRADMMELLQLASASGLRPMTETFALEDANRAHGLVRENKVRFRAVLTPA